MSTFVKSDHTTDLLVPTEFTNTSPGDWYIGAAVNVAALLAAKFYVFFAPLATTAAPTATEWAIEASAHDAEENSWVQEFSRLSPNVVPTNTTVASGGASAATSAVLTSGTGFLAGQYIFFRNGNPLLSEWNRIKSVASNTIQLVGPLANTQTGNNVFNQCELASVNLPLTAVRRIRAVVNNNRGTNRIIAMRMTYMTADSIG